MVKWIAALVLALYVQSCSLAEAAPLGSNRAAWDDACELSRYSCRGLTRPDVQVSNIVPGALGFYIPGTRTVYMAPISYLLEPLQRHAILVHEMVHYIQFKRGDVRGNSDMERCILEEEAFSVHDRVILKYKGDRRWLRMGNWRKKYQGCN